MKNQLLEILEKDSRIPTKDIAAMLGCSEEEVKKTIKKLEEEKIICGYPTLINWEKTNREGEFVTAMIEAKVAPQRERDFGKIAKRISNFDEVKTLSLMSGTFDLLIIVEGKNLRDISYFVSTKLATLDCILSTSTHFVLTKFKENGLILDEEKKYDERIIVSP